MSRNLLNYIIDVLLVIVMLAILGTGLLIRYQLPPGSRGGHGLEMWGWSRHGWGDLHFWLAVAAVALFVLHVALHWDWVVAVTQRQVLRQKAPQQKSSTARQNAWGVLFLLLLAALVGGWLWLAETNVYGGAADARGEHRAGAGRAMGREGGRGAGLGGDGAGLRLGGGERRRRGDKLSGGGRRDGVDERLRRREQWRRGPPLPAGRDAPDREAG